MDRLEEDYQDQLKVVSLDAIGDGEAAFEASNSRGHPSFLIMQPDGEEVWRRAGVVTFEDLEAAIQMAIQ